MFDRDEIEEIEATQLLQAYVFFGAGLCCVATLALIALVVVKVMFYFGIL